jgi:hypothetical protein
MNELTTPRALCIVLRSSVAKHIINAITIRCVYSARVSQCHFHFLYIHEHKLAPCRMLLDAREERQPPRLCSPRNTACRIRFCTLRFLHCVGGRSRFSAPRKLLAPASAKSVALFRISFPRARRLFAAMRFCPCGKRLSA